MREFEKYLKQSEFTDYEDFRYVWDNGIINKALISSLYKLPEHQITTLEAFDAAKAIKITFPRPRQQGSIGEVDMHAAQQHVPLMFIPID